MKRFIPAIVFFLIITGSTCNCKKEKIIQITGEAQGTTYQISILTKENKDHKPAIDSILRKIDSSLSNYLPASLISLINNNISNINLDEHFLNVFNKAYEISQKTNGAFDITVAPVINAWGFGFSKKEHVDSIMIRSLLKLVDYRKVKVQGNQLLKENEDIMLDFNAIAQGYAVDVVAEYLNKHRYENYFVELGGEVVAKGDKGNHEFWKIGIDKPKEGPVENRELKAIIKLYNLALATSGNYRKFYEEDGQKYSHIIDPKTGYPAKNNLLSVSVIAGDCMTADAYATAFMVMGMEKAKLFLEKNYALHLGVFFIYDEKGILKTYTSENLNRWLEIIN